MLWSQITKQLDCPDDLLDIYFRPIHMSDWSRLIDWIGNHPCLSFVNWYDPISDRNYDSITKDTNTGLRTSGFNFQATLNIDNMILSIHYFLPIEVECDVKPKEVVDQAHFEKLVCILDEIAQTVNVKCYSFEDTDVLAKRFL